MGLPTPLDSASIRGKPRARRVSCTLPRSRVITLSAPNQRSGSETRILGPARVPVLAEILASGGNALDLRGAPQEAAQGAAPKSCGYFTASLEAGPTTLFAFDHVSTGETSRALHVNSPEPAGLSEPDSAGLLGMLTMGA